MNRFWKPVAAALLGLASFYGSTALAADVKVETVLGGLSNPCGIAVQPETGVVFVSDSATGRIVRIVDGKAEVVIAGSPKDVYGKGPKYDIGPLGIAFKDKNTLVVGDGGFVDGQECVRVYTIPESGKAPLDYEKDVAAKLGPLAEEGEVKAEGNLYGIAVTAAGIYCTCNGDDTKGWVSMAEIAGAKYGPLKRFIATKPAVEVDAPVAITISPQGDVVIGQMGEINKPKDGLLTFYQAKTGQKLLNLEMGLYDPTGLAYSPKGLLYATDFAWMATGEGGLYRLDKDTKDGKTTLKTTKIAGLDKPTALAFGPDGTLYVTVVGATAEGETAGKNGAVLKIAPGL